MVNEQEIDADYNARCETCGGIAACKFAFGRYWNAKSDGGKGCRRPLASDYAKRLQKAIDDAKRKEAEEVMQAELEAARAEQSSAYSPRVWIVAHLRHTYETTAKTAEGAINNIRFKLYGTRPISKCSPFEAKPKQCGTITISSAAARLAAFAQAGRT